MKLVTVAVYNLPTQAQIARNSLEAAGIKAYVADAELVAMDLVLSSAVGGVKVQVSDADAQRAADVLTDIYGNAAGVTTDEVDEEELTRQALEAAPDDNEELPEDEQTLGSSPQTINGNEREDYANRFFFASVFSVIFAPLAAYGLYLFLNAVFSSGSWSKRAQMRMTIGVICLMLSPIFLILMLVFLSPFY